MRLADVAVILLALQGTRSYAQDPASVPPPAPETKHSGAPLGQFTAGPFVITPTFRIGTLAVDTNIQYERERRADFVASAGPGLDVAVSFLDHWKFDLQGGSQYMYFHRTKELRRWAGAGTATLFWATTGTRASLSTTRSRVFMRPSFEVDTRVASNQNDILGTLERDLGRLTVGVSTSYGTNQVDQGQEFRGSDLSSALTTRQYSAGGQFRYRVTVVTSLLLEGAYSASRFPKAAVRNFRQESLGLGFSTTGALDGQAVVGFRRNTLSNGLATKSQPYLRGNLVQELGPRFKLTGTYAHESTISAFAKDGSLPTFERRALTLTVAIELTKRMSLTVGGIREKLASDGLVNIVLDDGSTTTGRRNDVAYVGNAGVGVRLGRAQVVVFGSYTSRESLFFSDFGIEGLQAGARVEYAPR